MVIKPEVKALLADYDQNVVAFDELWQGEGQMRGHWNAFVEQLTGLGLTELADRNQELQRLLKDLGVTYNIYSNNLSKSVTWKLDPIPFVIAPDVWDDLEEGIKQRAKLLDLLLKDIYGKRMLIKDGIVPGELLFIDRRFLRPCVNQSTDQSSNLLLYGSDISRGPDGRLWVIGDRTQVPSGLSYMMVNRIALARTIPEFFLNAKVRKIVPFFQRIRENLIRLSPRNTDTPFIVLLTPGQFNETYFEHAFLAALQGYTLVQGNDLMVKDGFLWLKTLGGLEKVDIVVRHLDDDFCDPLSFRSDSQLGVAGLMEVVRQGNVTIANPLGSGILENPGLMAFMPSLCRYYLNEELKLPNIATWWCGQASAKQYVIEHIPNLIIKRLNKKGTKRRVLFGQTLSSAEIQELIKEINASPLEFVGQEHAIYSTAPSYSNGEILPYHTVLRCYGVAGKDEYDILPGGMTRRAPEIKKTDVSNQIGGWGKDTWVLGKEDVKQIEFHFKNEKPRYAYNHISDLSSGIASNMFWVGRYMTRAKLTVRFLRIILRYLSEIDNFRDPVDREVLSILLKAFTHTTLTYPGFVGEDGAEHLENPEPEVRRLICDANFPGSLAHSIIMWKGASNNIRNIWSADTWRIVDKVDQIREKIQADEAGSLRNLRNDLDELIDAILAAFGFIQQTLSLEEGGPLFDIGVDFEDSIMQAALLRSTICVRHDGRVEDELFEAVLLATGSLNTYRHRYRGEFQLAGVIELTMVDDTYPGSIAAGLKRLGNQLALLPQQPLSGNLRPDQRLVLKLSTALKLVEPFDLTKRKDLDDNLRKDLDDLLHELRNGLVESTNSITNRFFSHTTYKPQRSEFLFDPDF